MLDAMRTRRKQTTKEDQLISTMPHHGRIIVIPTHGGGAGHGGKEAHRSWQHHQLQGPLGAPAMAPRPDMPTGASMGAGDGSAASSSWVKPGCMMELARLAKIPPPESGLACPRCRSAETKFCYYNNYSLSQPRHFCRACRRYWTHGGALRDLPFSGTVRRRRHRNKPPPTNKHEQPSKVAISCCGGSGAAGGRASPSSSSSASAVVPGGGGGRAAADTAVMHTRPLEQLASLAVAVGAERHHTAAASRLWLPPAEHSSLQGAVGYRHHQLGNNITGAGVATTIRPEHQRHLPQRQPFSFVGYGDAAAVTAPTSAAGLLLGASDVGGFAGGQMMQAAAAISRVLGPAALATKPASEVMAGNPPIPSTEMMAGALAATTSSPGEFFLVESGGGLSHLLGSGSWACSYGSCSAGNDDGSGGSTSCAAAPGNNSVWPDPSSGLTSSSSGTML